MRENVRPIGGQDVRIRCLLDECLRREAGGEASIEDSVISAHPELMPALGEELKLLRVLRRAALQIQEEEATGASPQSKSVGKPSPSTEGQPSLPGYRFVREIHRGGQGVVYEAVQESTRRTVAVKFPRRGPFASENDRLRFDREVDILARMRHSNIVAIHDRGTASGADYLVMDFIEGTSLERWVRTNAPPENASGPESYHGLLLLFSKVCDAVHAAHLRGVIHRDLKPSNILVDHRGEPYVLDFGLAKELENPEAVTVTAEGQFIGSLPWAAPEQVRSESADVRTDVYSLGVILYESVTGRSPYAVTGAVAPIIQRIIHENPQRPSATISAIDDDLDTIVLKCLNKEPSRRYQSAGELKRDIDRYVRGEPIEAKRDSALYMLGKRLQRYRWAAVAGVVMMLLLASGIIGTVYGLVQAREQRQNAEQRRQEAEREREIAEAVSDFLTHDLMDAANPERPPEERDERISDVVARAARRVDSGALDGEAAVEAAVRVAIGNVALQLGRLDEAERHFRRSTELMKADPYAKPVRLLEVTALLAQVLHRQGRFVEATDVYHEGLAIAEPLGDAPNAVVGGLYVSYGEQLKVQGDLDGAEAMYAKALAAFEGDSSDSRIGQSVVYSNLGEIRRLKGDYQKAIAMADEALSRLRELYGDEHTHIATTLNNKGLAYKLMGDPEAAEPLYREALAMRQALLPPTHSDVAQSLNNLAGLLRDSGKYDEAERLYRQTLDAARQSLPPGHFMMAVIRRNLGNCLIRLERFEEAEVEFQAAYDQLTATVGLPPEHVRMTVEAFIKLYDAWAVREPHSGAEDKANEWRAKLSPTEQSGGR